jgi:transcriptional regulator with XRE-family HTH domain
VALRQTISGLLREKRAEAGLTQRQLAEALGVTHPYVCQVESGRTCFTAAKLRILGDVLDVDEQALFEVALSSTGKCSLEPFSPGSGKVLARLWRVWCQLEHEDLNVIWRQLQLAEKRHE